MRRLTFLALLVFALLLLARTTAAQSPCAHVDFRIDSALPVDRAAVCTAAEPWAERGINTFVYLTDADPGSEDAWFELLDQIEAEAGLRELGGGDVFDRTTLALEATTGSNAPWAQTITYGEALFGTDIDSDAAANQIKNALRQNLQEGDATAAFVSAITTAYEINYPPPSPLATGVTVALLVVGVLAVGGVVAVLLYRPVIRPALERRQRERQLATQLEVVQQSVANLLLACERLLGGETPTGTVLYQLFQAYGGEHYPERAEQVREWLRRSQAALSDAFDLRRSLLDEEVRQKQSLAEQVHNWEMIYLTLVGSSPRIRSLTNAELQDLLDPMIILEREAQDVQLAQQLDDIRRQIKGMPLKIDLMEVDPEKVDRDGILGTIDQVEAQIGALMAAQQEAPGAVEQAKRGRLAAEEEADQARPFGMTGSQILAGIDARLTQAENELQDRVFLSALETAASVQRDLEIVEDLSATAADHAARQEKIAAITAAGFRPAQLPSDTQEMASDIDNIVSHVTAGDYLTADQWLDELDADGDRAVAHAQAWQERHGFNEESLRLMRERLATVAAYLDAQTEPAWQALQAYPPGNWNDITASLEAERALLRELREERLPELARLNSLDVQKIPAAEAGLAEAGKDLVGLERRLEALVNRLAEIETAAANLAAGLEAAQSELDKAIAFRNAQDPKIGPDVDAQLAEATDALETARQQQRAREFIAAMRAQTRARQLTAEAQSAASEQVARIDALQAELGEVSTQAEQQARRTLALGEQLSALALTGETAALLRQVNNHLSTARQAQAQTMSLEDAALAEALATAVGAFKQARAVGQDAEQQANADHRAYQSLRREAEDAVQEAERAIYTAQRQVNHPDAGDSGAPALQRAEYTLPQKATLANASKEELKRIANDARLAAQYAREAERKAEQSITFRRMQRAAAWAIFAAPRHHRPSRPRSGGWTGGWSIPSSGPRTSNRSASRGSSWGMSRRSSSGGASRRSSAGGSRRSSSGGRSRRR